MYVAVLQYAAEAFIFLGFFLHYLIIDFCNF